MQTMHTLAPILLIFFVVSSHALPLSTSSRWIVDDSTGERVKLACANWPGHMEAMLPEGLHKRPLQEIALRVSLMGFNCIRLTYATYMFTRYANLTVAQSLQNLNLTNAIAGINQNNPDLLNATVVDAQKAVIEQLGLYGVMVLLDNQVSQPMWCCDDNDGNGFFGDKFFDPNEWLQGLSIVSNRYKDTPTVMAMSLRNELRGPLQNESVWYQYVEKGAQTIHSGNPNVLVLISGLYYDLDFQSLKNRSLNLNIGNKVVYETHRYSFSEGQGPWWINQPLNDVCANITQELDQKVGFLIKGKNPAPLFVTEFGADQLGQNPSDNNFLPCFMTYLVDNDLDWALWALQGSYYLRDGQQDHGENYGMFNSSWGPIRNPEYHSKLQFLQRKLQDPNSEVKNYSILYHPLSGKCARVDNNEIYVSECWEMSKWSHQGEGTAVKLVGTNSCLKAIGDGLPVALTNDCKSNQTKWKLASNSQLQLAINDGHGTDLCLDWDPYYSRKVVTNKCIVTVNNGDNSTNLQNPQSQWFKLVTSNIA